MDKTEDSSGKFGKVEFRGMEIGTMINLFLKCETKEDVDDLLGKYEKYCDTPEIAIGNLRYIFWYANKEDRKKLYALFPVTRPILGRNF
jgi:hypothetical protein